MWGFCVVGKADGGLWRQKSQARASAYSGLRIDGQGSRAPASSNGILPMMKLADDRKVCDFMDAKSSDLCGIPTTRAKCFISRVTS